jgi:hypothetical protein
MTAKMTFLTQNPPASTVRRPSVPRTMVGACQFRHKNAALAKRRPSSGRCRVYWLGGVPPLAFEQRKSPRRRMEQQVAILKSDGKLVCECTLADVSNDGARLKLSLAPGAPAPSFDPQFILSLSKRGQSVPKMRTRLAQGKRGRCPRANRVMNVRRSQVADRPNPACDIFEKFIPVAVANLARHPQ